MQQLIMIWDKIIAEEDVSSYLVYVCAALMQMLSKDIKSMMENPEQIILFIQDLPTAQWGNEEIKMLMAHTYQLQTLYKSNSHLSTAH